MKHAIVWLSIIVVGAGIEIYLLTEKNRPPAIAPDVHMMTECDSFKTAVHIFNLEDKAIKCSYKVYVDTNDNQMLDSSDIVSFTEPNIMIAAKKEYQGMLIKPLKEFKKYSFIVELRTDKLITYYESIPCDSQ